MSFIDKLGDLIKKYDELKNKLLEPEQLGSNFGKISKEYSDLEPIVIKATEYLATVKTIEEAESIIKDKNADSDLREIASEDLVNCKKKLLQLEEDLKILLLPKDETDEKNAILEIRAGTGGDEAALFGAVLLKMYQKYAERKGWKFEIMDISDNELGGVKEATISIKGQNVFRQLKFESGVHRVQRVPETESKGRVHTSAATVAVLPEVEDVDIHIDEKDLEITACRASGPGGQCVNTTDSAVRIVHLPTGITVRQQEEKSQFRNKDKALQILRAKLYELERNKRDSERAAERKDQIGSGDRSEKIRTYNYPQSRVTDHRINLTLYRIDSVTNEGDLDEIIEALIANDQSIKMASSNY